MGMKPIEQEATRSNAWTKLSMMKILNFDFSDDTRNNLVMNTESQFHITRKMISGTTIHSTHNLTKSATKATPNIEIFQSNDRRWIKDGIASNLKKKNDDVSCYFWFTQLLLILDAAAF